jgi:hypothetical protein
MALGAAYLGLLALIWWLAGGDRPETCFAFVLVALGGLFIIGELEWIRRGASDGNAPSLAIGRALTNTAWKRAILVVGSAAFVVVPVVFWLYTLRPHAGDPPLP